MMTGEANRDSEYQQGGVKGRRQVGFLWAGAVLSLLVLVPLGPWLSSVMWGCPFKEITGLPCPGCGTTRAALLLSRFDFLGAFSRFPLPTLGWIFFVGGGLVAGLWVVAGRDLPPLPRRLPRWVIGLMLTAVLANWAWSIATGV